MSFRGAFCQVLDKYKSGKWSRDEAADFLEEYFANHLPNSSKIVKQAYLNYLEDIELMQILDDWLIKGKYSGEEGIS